MKLGKIGVWFFTDRLTATDATFAWGDAEAVRQRIDAHLEAGASHVCIQPVNRDGRFGEVDWETLEALAP